MLLDDGFHKKGQKELETVNWKNQINQEILEEAASYVSDDNQ